MHNATNMLQKSKKYILHKHHTCIQKPNEIRQGRGTNTHAYIQCLFVSHPQIYRRQLPDICDNLAK